MPENNQTILVANRGEIAARILRTCREMDLNTVAVYSEFDRNAPFTFLADHAKCIGPAEASKSYLDLDRIIEVALELDVDLIHPGYGFLAENPAFPARCREEGIQFVGPNAEAIESIGDKTKARNIANQVDVPLVPGTLLNSQSEEDAGEAAQEIGFPVLIKAAAGGGGKGMRVVRDSSEFGKAFREAQREAKASFGDPTVFIEKYFDSPRHIEIQILADHHGNAVHFGERECSIQRRHQKLIEEAPSTALSPELRDEMGEAALQLVREAGYENAGTVEFLLDEDQNYYFLEVNTRLQVEHPVTELITGFDLVREQIRVARGEKLDYTSDDINFRGWALECRICAEDPANGFVPVAGTVKSLREPGGPFTRFDNGVQQGTKIGLHYDSMMGKLITWGENRDRAVRRMRRALRETLLVGVTTTIPLYLQILKDEEFLDGNLSTTYLEDFEINGSPAQDREEAAVLAAGLSFLRESRLRTDPSSGNEFQKLPLSRTSNWFTNGLRRNLDNGR